MWADMEDNKSTGAPDNSKLEETPVALADVVWHADPWSGACASPPSPCAAAEHLAGETTERIWTENTIASGCRSPALAYLPARLKQMDASQGSAVLNPAAPSFSPTANLLTGPLVAMQELIEAQNHTIAGLSAKLDAWHHWADTTFAGSHATKHTQRDCVSSCDTRLASKVTGLAQDAHGMSDRLAQMEKHIDRLTKTLGSKVQESIDKRTEHIAKRIDSIDARCAQPVAPSARPCQMELEKSIHEGIMEAAEHLVTPMLSTAISTAVHVGLKETMGAFAELFNKKLAHISSRLHKHEVDIMSSTLAASGTDGPPLNTEDADKLPVADRGAHLHNLCAKRGSLRHDNCGEDSPVSMRTSPTCSEFLEMARLTKLKLPHVFDAASRKQGALPLCIMDASIGVQIIMDHAKRSEWGKSLNLSSLSLASAAALSGLGDFTDEEANVICEAALAGIGVAEWLDMVAVSPKPLATYMHMQYKRSLVVERATHPDRAHTLHIPENTIPLASMMGALASASSDSSFDASSRL